MTDVTLRIGRNTKTLQLDRMCIFLRFVVKGNDWTTLDALNEVGDKATPGETIIPAKIDGNIGTMHIDRTVDGKHVGEWRQYASYLPVECPLTQEQLADYDQWAAWCDTQSLTESAK